MNKSVRIIQVIYFFDLNTLKHMKFNENFIFYPTGILLLYLHFKCKNACLNNYNIINSCIIVNYTYSKP